MYLSAGGYLGTAAHQRYLPSPCDQFCGYRSPGEPAAQYISSLEVSIESSEHAGESCGRAEGRMAYLASSLPPEEAYARNRLTSLYAFDPKPFLSPQRHQAQFVGEAEDIACYVREAFRETTGENLPEGITFRVCSAKEMRRIHASLGSVWSPSILGFSVNRSGSGASEIFVLENFLDELLVVLGHELGHVLSAPLPTARDEEAKAFAFQAAWLHTLKESNIAGLGASFVSQFSPAKNGLHDVASAFVGRMLAAGKKALALYRELVAGALSLDERLVAVTA